MFCCCCLGNDHSERCIFSINNLLVLQKTFKCKACGYVVDESRVDEHRQTYNKISEFKGTDLFEEQVDIIPELISPRINSILNFYIVLIGNTKFYQCLKCTYALPANLKEIHVSLCSNLYQTDNEQFKEISKEQYDAITTDYIQCGFCYKFIPQYELNEHSKICPIYIAKKPFRKYCYGDYFEIFVENEMQKKSSNCSLHINENNNNEDDLADTPIPQLKKAYQQPIRINNVVISTSSGNNFKRFGSAEEEVSTPMRLQQEYDAKQQQQQKQQQLLKPNNDFLVVDNTPSSNSFSLLTPASTKPIIISAPSQQPSTSSISNNNSRNRTQSDCNRILSNTTSPTPVNHPPPHRHSCGSIDTKLTINSPVEEARTRARTSLSRGYDVRKHCRGISKSHNTVILLSENELVWKSKGGNEFSSIGLNSISKVLCNKNRVTIKSSERDLIIDIENENDRNEFVSSLRTLIIPPK